MARLTKLAKMTCGTLLLLSLALELAGRQEALPQTTLSVNVQMVEVYASVFDAKGRRVSNLPKENFEVLEDGVKQSIDLFESQASGLDIALLVDTTSSMTPLLPRVKNGVSDLLDLLSPGDRAGLFTFNTRLNVLQQFTQDRRAVLAALMNTHAEGATALYDALAQLAQDLSKKGGKKVILLFTDGLDNRSMIRLESATTAIRRVGVPIYTVAQGDLLKDPEGLKRLKTIATDTNGIAFEARNTGDLQAIVSKLSEDLQHLYLLGYYSNNADSKSGWHQITVRLPSHPELKLRAKEGYLAATGLIR